ncbi:hypothetical protein ACFLT7_01795 [candidate division KSB1 bacterium]
MAARLKWSAVRRESLKWIARYLPRSSPFGGDPQVSKSSLVSSYHLLRAHLNHHSLGRVHDWVLPYWAERQLRVDSDSFHPAGPQALLDNCIRRNWTRLGRSRFPQSAVVDPRGLVSPVGLGFSLDFWLKVEDRLILPSRVPGIVQSLYEASPIVETAVSVEGWRLRTWAWADLAAGQPVIQGLSLLKGVGPERPVSLFLALRPFNPEGFFPVGRIEYRPPCLLCVDGCVGLVLGREPSRLIVGNLKEGDLTGLPKSESGLGAAGTVDCPRGLATMAAEYKLEGKGEDEILVPWALPLDRLQPGRKPEAGLVLVPDDRGPDPVVARLGGVRTVIESQDRLLSSAFKAAADRAADLPWVSTPPIGLDNPTAADPEIGLWYQEVLIRTDRLDEWYAGWKKLLTLVGRDGAFRGRSGRWDLVAMALRQASRVSAMVSEEPQRTELLKSARRLASSLRSSPAVAEECKLYRDCIWAAAALDRIADSFSGSSMDEEADACRKTARSVWNRIDPWLTPDGEEPISAGPQMPVRLDALTVLPALGLPDFPWKLDARFKATVGKIMSLSSHGELLPADGPAPGISISRSILMALAMVRLGLPTALDYIEAIIRMMTGTYNFPQTVNPSTGAGVTGDGHDLLADAMLAVLVTDLAAFQEKNRLWITPVPALGWFAKGESFVVENLLTDFGKLSFRVDGLADRVVLALKPAFVAPPERISFTVPFYAGKALLDGVETEMDTRTIGFDPAVKKVVVYRETAST